jgi:hypothetical protein
MPGTLRQQLWRDIRGSGARPVEKVWESTEDQDSYRVRQWLQTSADPPTTYWYFHTATCQQPSGQMVTGATYGVPFSLHVIEDPWVHFTYSGVWIQRAGGTGGTTHEARQVGATATFRAGGIAAAWVTTVDEKDYPIWARVMWDGCSWPACPRWIDTGSDPFGDARVVKWSSSWNENSYGRYQTVQVISEESRRVDVDAFVLVVPRRP